MKNLKFIHIPKTAGSSIEDVGFNAGIRWGRNHKEYGCHHQLFALKPPSLKDKYDWFVVVRNPYDRLLSEFHYEYGVVGSIELFNQIVQNSILERCKTGWHWTEQYKYIDKNYNICILKFEDLPKCFDDLMEKYNLPIKLDIKTNESNKCYEITNFSKETLKLINYIYHKDFIYFGYDKIGPELKYFI